MTNKSAGTTAEMELEALEAESTKSGHASTPTKLRAALVTRRRPLAPPMYVYVVRYGVGGGGPQGGRALWALTFYNPNLGLPTRERRPVERLYHNSHSLHVYRHYTQACLIVLVMLFSSWKYE